MKVCIKCKKELPDNLDFFHADKNTKDKLHRQCKKCRSTAAKIYHIKNREQNIKREKEWRSKNKEKIKKRRKEYRIKEKNYVVTIQGFILIEIFQYLSTRAYLKRLRTKGDGKQLLVMISKV